jgi:hypothetical protein
LFTSAVGRSAVILKYLDEVVVNLVAVVIVFIARLMGFDIYSRSIRGSRRAFALIRRAMLTKTVLLYTDCNDDLTTSRTLATNLRKQLRTLGIRVRVKVTKDGVDLTRWSFSTSILSIIILITDVTQLSARPKDRETIQKRLARYVHRGGCLVLGHDVIYRRSRNERLQRLAGGTLDDYEPVPGAIEYTRIDSGPRACQDKDLLADLPPTLKLADNEIVTGQWHSGVDFLYCHGGNERVPLVTHRAVARGRVFWVNSGNTNKDGPPPALARPEGFVGVVSALIRHS